MPANIQALTNARVMEVRLDDNDHKRELTAQDARGGKELGVMRYVLHISLALAVIAGIVTYLIIRR